MQKVVAPPYEGLQPVGGWTLGIGTDAVIGLSEPLSWLPASVTSSFHSSPVTPCPTILWSGRAFGSRGSEASRM